MRRRAMRKRVQLLGMAVALCVIAFFAVKLEKTRAKLLVDENNDIVLVLEANGREEKIYSWENPTDGKKSSLIWKVYWIQE